MIEIAASQMFRPAPIQGFVEVEWAKGPDGRFGPRELPGTEKVISADLVLLAMGFLGPEKPLLQQLGVKLDERGIRYRLVKIPMAAVLRTRTLSETRGVLKALIEVGGDRILGFTAFGPEAGEVMAAVQVAMIAGMTRLNICRSSASSDQPGRLAQGPEEKWGLFGLTVGFAAMIQLPLVYGLGFSGFKRKM